MDNTESLKRVLQSIKGKAKEWRLEALKRRLKPESDGPTPSLKPIEDTLGTAKPGDADYRPEEQGDKSGMTVVIDSGDSKEAEEMPEEEMSEEEQLKKALALME